MPIITTTEAADAFIRRAASAAHNAVMSQLGLARRRNGGPAISTMGWTLTPTHVYGFARTSDGRTFKLACRNETIERGGWQIAA